jgi:hypothetical protein
LYAALNDGDSWRTISKEGTPSREDGGYAFSVILLLEDLASTSVDEELKRGI